MRGKLEVVARLLCVVALLNLLALLFDWIARPLVPRAVRSGPMAHVVIWWLAAGSVVLPASSTWLSWHYHESGSRRWLGLGVAASWTYALVFWGFMSMAIVRGYTF